MRAKQRIFAGFALCALLAPGCTNFPTIAGDECGNGVIEAPEDCDTFSLGAGTKCRPKGTDGECHLDCALQDGARARCPPGWGCGDDGICRQPTGDFEPPAAAMDVGAWTLASGDFDGDGRADVMSLEPLDSIGATRLRFHYFDEQAQLEDTRELPKLLISPVVKQLSGDLQSDVLFSVSAVGVLLGRPDRSFVPQTFSSYRAPAASVRAIGVLDRRVAGISPFVSLLTLGSSPSSGFYVPDGITGQLTSRATFAGTVANLAGDPVSGNVFEDPLRSPCLEPVLAERGASHFTVVNVCDTDATGQVAWREPLAQTNILLDPRAPVDSGPLLVDLNGDGHLDVLIDAGGKPYASYGDGATLSVATPYRLPFPSVIDGTFDIPMPLAAGDVSGDGVPDFVLPDQLLISGTSGEGTSYSPGVNRLGAPWTIAKIADFNGNGKLDIVAATSGALDLQFFNGTGSPALTSNIISTSAPVAALTTGDFDGDLVADLALLETRQPGEEQSSLLLAFGTPFALPAAPVAIAAFTEPAQLASYDADGISNLIVAGRESVAGASSGTLTLLDGSGDRIPVAPYTLSEFSSNGSVQDAFAISLAAGSFSAEGQGDVLAVGISGEDNRELWLAPALESPGSVPERLADLDPVLNPAVIGSFDFKADIASASSDLDRDGRDEGIFAMPAGPDRTQCGVLIVGAVASNSPTLAARAPLVLGDACPDPQLQAGDLDGDGFPDLLLLTGSDKAGDRELLVLWNDGSGGFSSSDSTLAVSRAESPRAFTLLSAAQAALPPRPLGLAYVTKSSAELISLSDTRRVFAAPRPLGSLAGGTGIVASDVNGDGLPDLVLAASGKLSVLKARLEVP